MRRQVALAALAAGVLAAAPACGARVEAPAALPAGIRLARDWIVEPAARGEAPRLRFRFPSPLDTYAGEVGEIHGKLHLTADGSLDGAHGWVEAASRTVTMGDAGLDKMVVDKLLKADAFPWARFDVAKIDAPSGPLAFGKFTEMEAHGTFEMIGLSVPMDVRAQVEPIPGEDGAPRLHVIASARFRLMDPFGIEGPTGPSPANDTVVLYLDFTMTGAVTVSAAGSAVQM